MNNLSNKNNLKSLFLKKRKKSKSKLKKKHLLNLNNKLHNQKNKRNKLKRRKNKKNLKDLLILHTLTLNNNLILKIKKLKDQLLLRKNQWKRKKLKFQLKLNSNQKLKSRKIKLNNMITINRLMSKMDIMDQRNSFQESMKSKLGLFLKIEEITLSKPKPDTELEMLGVNMDMKNSKTQEEILSKKLKESLKTKHSKAQESTLIK